MSPAGGHGGGAPRAGKQSAAGRTPRARGAPAASPPAPCSLSMPSAPATATSSAPPCALSGGAHVSRSHEEIAHMWRGTAHNTDYEPVLVPEHRRVCPPLCPAERGPCVQRACCEPVRLRPALATRAKACSLGSVGPRAHRGGRHAMAATGPGVHSAAACAPERLRRLTPPPASATASSRPPALHAIASARPASCARA